MVVPGVAVYEYLFSRIQKATIEGTLTSFKADHIEPCRLFWVANPRLVLQHLAL
jgi:hypothetical protein